MWLGGGRLAALRRSQGPNYCAAERDAGPRDSRQSGATRLGMGDAGEEARLRKRDALVSPDAVKQPAGDTVRLLLELRLGAGRGEELSVERDASLLVSDGQHVQLHGEMDVSAVVNTENAA